MNTKEVSGENAKFCHQRFVGFANPLRECQKDVEGEVSINSYLSKKIFFLIIHQRRGEKKKGLIVIPLLKKAFIKTNFKISQKKLPKVRRK